MKYSKLTRRYAKWLFQFVDRHDWAASHLDGTHYSRNCENWQLVDAPYPPQRLTRTAIQMHLDRQTQLHYLSAKDSPTILITLDFDEHHGEGDSLDAAMYVQENYLPNSFLERTPHGCRLFFLLYVESAASSPYIDPARSSQINSYLAELQRQLAVVIHEAGYKSPVEVLGGFTVFDPQTGELSRGQTASIPMLWQGEASMALLEALPEYFAATAFQKLYYDAMAILETGAGKTLFTPLDVYVSQGTSTPGSYRKVNSSNAFDKMVKLCFDYTSVHRQMPDEDQLLERYAAQYGPTIDDAHQLRRSERAFWAIKGRAKKFDESKALEAGYEACKPALLSAVVTHAVDRKHKYDRAINDEDLAIGLYVIQRNSFSIADSPRNQWSCPNNCFTEMFDRLQKAGLTERKGTNRNKLVAIKTILVRAGLADCLDDQWEHHGDGRAGVGKKYVIGRNHWRYAHFVQFSEDVTVEYVGRKQQAAPNPDFVLITES